MTAEAGSRVLKAGWLAVFFLLAFGNTSLGLLVILAGMAWSRVQGGWRPRVADRAHRWFLFLLGLMALSAVLSPVKWVAGSLTFGYALLVLGFVFGAQWVVDHPGLLESRLLPALVAGSCASYGYAILHFILLRPERAQALFAGFNGLGTLVVMATGVSLGFLLGQPGRWRLLAVPYLALALTALLLTFSRGAWLGFLGLMVTFGVVNQSTRRWALGAAAALALALALVPQFTARFLTSFQVSANQPRLYIWRSTLNMIKDHPVFGVGAGVFMHVYSKYVLPGAPEPSAAFAHNLFLQVTAEFGFVGLVVFVAILVRVLWLSWRLARTGNLLYQGIFAALVGVLIHQQVDIPIWGLDIGGGFWTLVGLVIALHGQLESRPEGRLRT